MYNTAITYKPHTLHEYELNMNILQTKSDNFAKSGHLYAVSFNILYICYCPIYIYISPFNYLKRSPIDEGHIILLLLFFIFLTEMRLRQNHSKSSHQNFCNHDTIGKLINSYSVTAFTIHSPTRFAINLLE